MRALTWEQAYFLGGAIGAALAALGVRWPVARTNLEIVFGNRLTLVEKRRIFKAAWVNFGRVAINHLRLPYMPPEFWSSHVRFPDEGNLRALFDRRRGIIIACGHMGMMDLAGGRLGKCGYPVAVVAKPMRSPSIDHLVLSAREALYMSTIPHRDSARRILKGLRSGEAIFFIIDQNMKRSQGIFVDWFGQPASVSPAAAVFARQTKAPVVAGYLEQTGPKQFILHMSAPLPWISIADDPDTELVVNSQNQANAYQKLILAKPELWFWIHRRWKIQPKGKKWPYPN
ncbi:MAG: lysophospholipid acyltransferase family protein [Desulfosarcinaceae bacterium]|nr:lysophospholipid acyltransferase family protein [Desulfosarcinaceae bacterium]